MSVDFLLWTVVVGIWYMCNIYGVTAAEYRFTVCLFVSEEVVSLTHFVAQTS